jgi:hypothetical protein
MVVSLCCLLNLFFIFYENPNPSFCHSRRESALRKETDSPMENDKKYKIPLTPFIKGEPKITNYLYLITYIS